jgi:K+-transporting ATPase c subunit
MSEKVPTTVAADGSSFIVIDIEKRQKAKQIRRLRKGTGKLTEKIKELVDELREQRTISAEAQPVVIVVRQKASRPKSFF